MTTDRAWFVTGTDTGIGKTHVSCALLRGSAARGLRAAAMKPVAAGADRVDGRWLNEDTARLMTAANVDAPVELVTPYCLSEPIAPHVAAREAGVEIDFGVLQKAFDTLRARCDRLFVEGAGGLLVPTGPDRDFADLAAALGLPVILVVGMRLGCINHALLTTLAIRERGLTLAGWVANRVDPHMLRFEDNLETLRARIDAPLIAVVGHGEDAVIDIDQALAER